MTESITSQINFSKLISHTFPGVFAAIGIFMIIYLMFSDSIKDAFSLMNIFDNWTLFLGAFSGLIFIGTIIGIIIDAIHHLIEEVFLEKIIDNIGWAKKRRNEINTEENHLLKSETSDVLINSSGKEFKWFYYLGFLSIDRFTYIDDNYYCYQECLFNLSISFLFSSIIYASFLSNIGFSQITIIYTIIGFISISIVCFIAGLIFYLNLKLDRVYFIKGALDHLSTKQKKNDISKL